MATKAKTQAKKTPATETTSGIALDAGFKEAKVFEVTYHLTCRCDVFSAAKGHESHVEDLGIRTAKFAVCAENLNTDGSFDTNMIMQVVRDQILIPEFVGHEHIRIQIVQVNTDTSMEIPTFVVL